MDIALRALNRFGLGARPADVRPVASDPRGWLEVQLEGPPHLDGTGDRLPDMAELGRVLQAYRRRQRSGDLRGSDEARTTTQIVQAEAAAALSSRVASDRPFLERWVAFWSNHLCVSAARAFPVRLMAGHYEREAIRPHVLGRFEEMALASARHPAMLVYLDNVRSVGPDSTGARLADQRRARRGRAARRESPGLNENYARELLELHTVGVDGGYTQDDVTELARLLTGWTVAGLRPQAARPGADMPEEFGYAFAEMLHEPGRKTVLGRRFGEGEAEGERAIRELCRHRSTATFLAGKLVRHFVADDPPADALARVARIFLETQGDLREVARALIHLDAAWAPEHAKFRTPQDWLVAAARALGATAASPGSMALLGQLRHPLWAPPSPKGYGDTVREWADPDALMNRAELARALAGRVRRTPDTRVLAELVDVPADDPLRGVLADELVPVDERVALALAGPAFQWR